MIERLPKHYVSDTYVQIRIPFVNSVTFISSFFDKEGILCHYDFRDDSQNVNKYIDDDRKCIFPYHNIPIYKELYGNFYDGFNQKYYINQILEFNRHYISVVKGVIRDRYIVKDGDEALIYNRILDIPNYIEGKIIDKKTFINKYINNNILCINKIGQYVDFKDNCENFFDSDGGLLIIRNNNYVVFRMVDIVYNGKFYSIREYDIPFNNYKVEELKAFESKIKCICEPKIYTNINPNIHRSEIKKAKKMVKKLSK